VPAKVGLAQPALQVELRGSRGVGVVAVVRDLLEGVGAHLGEREVRAAAGMRRAVERVFHQQRGGSLRGRLFRQNHLKIYVIRRHRHDHFNNVRWYP
jgi:hypothetical protein